MNKKLYIKVQSIKQSLTNFKNLWKDIDSGKKLETPINILSFESSNLLINTLIPRRLELLQQLHDIGKSNLGKITKKFDGNQEQVEKDIKVLVHTGLVVQEKDKYYVPWDSIVTELPLSLPKEKKNLQSHFRPRLAH